MPKAAKRRPDSDERSEDRACRSAWIAAFDGGASSAHRVLGTGDTFVTNATFSGAAQHATCIIAGRGTALVDAEVALLAVYVLETGVSVTAAADTLTLVIHVEVVAVAFAAGGEGDEAIGRCVAFVLAGDTLEETVVVGVHADFAP